LHYIVVDIVEYGVVRIATPPGGICGCCSLYTLPGFKELIALGFENKLELIGEKGISFGF
jgi:hypothetical protein